MTKKRKYYAGCHECGGVAICEDCGAKVPSSTPFSDWLRDQPEIDSKIGFVTTNIDYLWGNHKKHNWMLIEEKRYNGYVSWSQRKIFDVIDWCAKKHSGYKGFHIVRFENATPDDGKIFWDNEEISRDELLSILKFESR